MKFSSLCLLWVMCAAVLALVAAKDEKSTEDVEEILAEEMTTEEKAKKGKPPTKEGAKKEATPTTSQGTKQEGTAKGEPKKEAPATEGAKKETPATGDGAKKETPTTADGSPKQTPSTTSEGAKEGATTSKEGQAAPGEKPTGDAEVKGDESESKGEVGDVEKKEEPVEEHEAPTGIRDPRPCEVCKYLAVELQGRLVETGRRKQYIETGHGIMPGDRKRKDYRKSELRFIEALTEPHVCDRLLGYDVHAERKKSLRYAKGSSETRRTLHGLVNKGVRVDLGIPYEIWKHDAPPNEITHLQRLCIELVEEHEDDIEEWYWGYQDKPLLDYLCRDRYLKNKNIECLGEEFKPEEPKEESKEEEKPEEAEKQDSTAKGDTGKKSNEKPYVPPSLSSADPKAESTKPKSTGQSASKESKPTKQSASKESKPTGQSASKEEL